MHTGVLLLLQLYVLEDMPACQTCGFRQCCCLLGRKWWSPSSQVPIDLCWQSWVWNSFADSFAVRPSYELQSPRMQDPRSFWPPRHCLILTISWRCWGPGLGVDPVLTQFKRKCSRKRCDDEMWQRRTSEWGKRRPCRRPRFVKLSFRASKTKQLQWICRCCSNCSISDLQLLVVIAGVDFMPELRYQELLCPVIGGCFLQKRLVGRNLYYSIWIYDMQFRIQCGQVCVSFCCGAGVTSGGKKKSPCSLSGGYCRYSKRGPHLLGTLVTLVWCKLHVNFRYALGRTEGRAVLEVLPDLLLCHGSSRRIWRDPETGIKFKKGTECFLAPLWEDICDGVAWLFSTCSCWGRGVLLFHCAVWKCRLTMTCLAPCLDVEVMRSKHLEVEELPALCQCELAQLRWVFPGGRLCVLCSFTFAAFKGLCTHVRLKLCLCVLREQVFFT